MPLLAVRKLIEDFNEAQAQRKTKEGLYLVNTLKQTPVDGDVVWFAKNAVGGLSPLVSPMQNSPVVSQGTYREMKAGAIETRHVKRFTNKELNNILSPDDRFRISEKKHIALELADMERRIFETMEFVGWSALARGSVRYVSTETANKVDVNISFPSSNFVSKTAAATWSSASTTIVTHMDAWLDEFELKFGKRPDVIRMTKTTWNYIKANTEVKNQFTNWIRTTGITKGDIPAGMITPDFVAKACDWPAIEIKSERTMVNFTAKNNESAASNVVVELNEGTWGLSVGDKVLCGYNFSQDTWNFEATVETVNHGVSIVIDIPTGYSITAGDNIVSKPTFFPEQKVQLIADESASEFILPPFGIDYSGSTIQANKFRGPYFDAFMEGREPNLAVYKRAWHSFGIAFGSKVMSSQVIV